MTTLSPTRALHLAESLANDIRRNQQDMNDRVEAMVRESEERSKLLLAELNRLTGLIEKGEE
jgi:hypothetical protein